MQPAVQARMEQGIREDVSQRRAHIVRLEEEQSGQRKQPTQGPEVEMRLRNNKKTLCEKTGREEYRKHDEIIGTGRQQFFRAYQIVRLYPECIGNKLETLERGSC